MVGSGTEGSDFDLMLRIPSSVTVNDDASVFMVDVVDGHFFNELELWFGEGDVGVAPVDSLHSDVVLDDTGVFGLSAGLEAGVGTKGSIGRDERGSGEGV
jgi:hypothetical protein